jgi:hypothetical protein
MSRLVIAGHSASEDARERAYDPAIHPPPQEDTRTGYLWISTLLLCPMLPPPVASGLYGLANGTVR